MRHLLLALSIVAGAGLLLPATAGAQPFRPPPPHYYRHHHRYHHHPLPPPPRHRPY